jgi:hypothetical protein
MTAAGRRCLLVRAGNAVFLIDRITREVLQEEYVYFEKRKGVDE